MFIMLIVTYYSNDTSIRIDENLSWIVYKTFQSGSMAHYDTDFVETLNVTRR